MNSLLPDLLRSQHMARTYRISFFGLIILKFFKKSGMLLFNIRGYDNIHHKYWVLVAKQTLHPKLTRTYHPTFKRSNKFYLSLHALRIIDIRTGESWLILLTSHGLMTHKTALRKQMGGLLMGILYR